MNDYLVVGAIAVFVESRVQSDIRCADFEKAVGFSTPHLRAVFSRCTGQPLARYVMSRRISRAAFDIVHSRDTLLEISQRYGFANPDTFTRAFRRVTGVNPKDFRKAKPFVGRVALCAGVCGVSVNPTDGAAHQNILVRTDCMHNDNGQDNMADGSAVLYGVPKVHYGAFGGCTPYPICLKAAANYIGIELDYEDAIVQCGAAFRLVWDTTAWNEGNVDVLFTFDDPVTVFKSGIESLAREFKMLGRDGSGSPTLLEDVTTADDSRKKSDFIAFIKESIDKGVPVIALGIIGPPEACVITGYRGSGQTLLGWNCFQEFPDFAAGVTIDESGYFVTSSWWENIETAAVMSIGEKTGEPQSLQTIVERAVTVLSGRQYGKYAKGIDAYDAWKMALLDESQFAGDLIIPLQVQRLMCQGDGADCLYDGRSSAHKYFKRLADKNPEQRLYGLLAKQFELSAAGAYKMYETLGGCERGEAQMKKLMKPDIRQRLAERIDECKAADEKALALLKELADNL